MESVRRVSSIALVHDALSMSAGRGGQPRQVIDRILPIMNDVASVDAPIKISRTGALRVLDADRATALIGGDHRTRAERHRARLRPGRPAGLGGDLVGALGALADVIVHDDGRGMPDGFSLEKSDRLGLQIVRTLIAAELDGSLGMHAAEGGGTDVVLRFPTGRRANARKAATVSTAEIACG